MIARFVGIILGAALACAQPPAAQAQEALTPAPKDAVVYFHSPLDGQTVPQRVAVRIGLRGMGIAPAGVQKPNTGHHHLLIDTDLPPLDRPVPNDYNHLHLGNGQTEIRVTLSPGRHTLQLLLADQNHLPHNPPIISKKITVRVRAGDPDSNPK